MPVVTLPGDLREQLENVSGTINRTDGPGVAVYWAADRSARADIYVGLILDGLKFYQNISSVNPSIKLQFVHKPTVSCKHDDVYFDPNTNALISIKVSDRS